jgi:hypothetical protein
MPIGSTGAWTRTIILLACTSALLCGCATMRYPCAYKVEGKEAKDFKDLDDDRALKLVALIYNVKCETREDGIARSISLEEYQSLLARRKSEYIKRSGIFDIQYEKVRIAKWSDDDIIKLGDCLSCRTGRYYSESAGDLSETQNAERIMYLTAMGSIAKELKKRDITRKSLLVAGQVLSAALTFALAFI